MTKINVGIVFGGKSPEHEVSVRSAKNVYEALDKSKFEPVLIGIDQSGKWMSTPEIEQLIANESSSTEQTLAVHPGFENSAIGSQTIDVVFPVLHGANGEDGTIQGLLRLANLPFVGPDVLGSAVGMDKDICKRVLQSAGIKLAPWITLRSHQKPDYERIENELSYPMFVKPANAGSSVGVSKAKNRADLTKAIEVAFQFDHKILIETGIEGQEVECGVFGNIGNMQASVPGEIIPHLEFYNYDAKYINADGAGLQIPAKIDQQMTEQVQELAIQICETLDCEGLSRVDFFVQQDKSIIFNEINTIPGFTNISMYPKMFEASGIGYSELIEKLIHCAIERFKRDAKKATNFLS
jgi:D-alanine-D-alanine ligase